MGKVRIYPTSDYARDKSYNSDDGTTNLYSYIDEAIASDTDYIYIDIAENQAGYATFNMGDPSLPTGVTIDRITLYARLNPGINSSPKFRLVIDSTNYDYDMPVPSSFTTFSKRLVTNPDTSTAWTESDIDDLIYGCSASTTSSKGATPDFSQLYIEITYTDPDDELNTGWGAIGTTSESGSAEAWTDENNVKTDDTSFAYAKIGERSSPPP